jgi:hypothetical protein
MLFRPSLFLTTKAMAPIVTREETGTVGMQDREEAKPLVITYMPKMYNNQIVNLNFKLSDEHTWI